MGTLLSIYLESYAGPNMMIQQVTQRMDDTRQDPYGAHRWALEAAKLLTVVAPPAGVRVAATGAEHFHLWDTW